LREGHLVGILILDCRAVLFHVGLLAHGANSLVVRFYSYSLDFTNRHSINCLLVRLIPVCPRKRFFLGLYSLLEEEASHLGLLETSLLSLILANLDVVLKNFDGGVGLANFVGNSLHFMFFHLAGDRGPEVLWAGFLLVAALLDLDFDGLVVDDSTSQHGVKLEQELVGCVGCTVDDRVVIHKR
jgi:hypothetical protein